jgi:hypothetical protein
LILPATLPPSPSLPPLFPLPPSSLTPSRLLRVLDLHQHVPRHRQ